MAAALITQAELLQYLGVLDMYKEKIINIITGEETIRDYTPEEIAEAKAFQTKLEKQQAEAETRQAIRSSALAKLAELGLTPDEVASL